MFTGLVNAAQTGDLAVAQRLLSKGSDVSLA